MRTTEHGMHVTWCKTRGE